MQAMRDEPQRMGCELHALDEVDLTIRADDPDVCAFGLLLARTFRGVAPAPASPELHDDSDEEMPPRPERRSTAPLRQAPVRKEKSVDVKSPFAAQRRHSNNGEAVKYPMRLLHVKGSRKVRVWQVPADWSSLNQGDFFILDNGLEVALLSIVDW